MTKSKKSSQHFASSQSTTWPQEIDSMTHSTKFSHQQHIKYPKHRKKITEFAFTEPEFSYHDIAERQKYRPMKHGIHYLDEDSTLYYNTEIEASEWVDEVVTATIARDAATADGQNGY